MTFTKYLGACLIVGAIIAWIIFAVADAIQRGMVNDCKQLGGFRYDDQVYTCDRIRPNGQQSVPLQPR